jgi:Transposase
MGQEDITHDPTSAYARPDHPQARRGHKLLAGGTELDEVCRRLQIAESTWHRWVAQHGGMKANDAKRLKRSRG